VRVLGRFEYPLGKVPGIDAAFVWNAGDPAIRIVSLDGPPASPNLLDFAASIPIKDPDGRRLWSIKAAGHDQLVLNYDRPLSSGLESSPQQHVELVRFP
jgi:hypothetical protein